MANAVDVYPPRDLPGRADDWGRRVEGVAEDLYKTQVQLRQTVENGRRATAGQLALLSRQLERISEQQADISEQQQDLLGRESHAVFWVNSPVSVSSNVNFVEMSQLSLTFELKEKRWVRMQTTVDVSASRGSGAASALASIYHFVDGSQVDFFRTSNGYARGVVVNEPMLSQSVALSLVELNPGVHTLTPKYSTLVTPNGFVVFSAGSTVVDVLQRAS